MIGENRKMKNDSKKYSEAVEDTHRQYRDNSKEIESERGSE